MTGGIWVRKILVYLIGLFVVAMGISIAIKTQLGVSTVTSLPYVLSRVFFWSQGTWITIVYCIFVLAQIVILGKKFRPVNLLQFAVSILFGYYVNLSSYLIAGLQLPNYLSRLIFMIMGILCMASGVGIYLSAGILPLSPDGLVLAIQQKTGRQFAILKLLFDSTMVLLAFLFGILSGNGVIGLREGTVVTALALGPSIGFFTKYIGKPLRVFCCTK